MNRLAKSKRIQIAQCLVEGVGINATCRMVGVCKPAVLKLLADLGTACARYHDENVRGLQPETVQTDEVWSFNYCKQKRVATAKAAPAAAGDVWLWTAITDQKLIAAYHVGLRTQHDADKFMLDLAGRITNRTQLTSDALSAYEGAVINAFGHEIDYGQVRKVFGSECAGQGAERKYSPGQCCKVTTAQVLGLPDRANISTSHIERHNLTVRMQMRRFTRLTNAHSKKIENHIHSIAIFMAYYNFVRPHQSLNGKTPAQASGLADHRWTIQ
jgi:IS1 family transposase